MTNPGGPTDPTSTVPGDSIVTPPPTAPVPAVTTQTAVAETPIVTAAPFAGSPTVTQSQISAPAAASSEKLGPSETIKLRMQVGVSVAVLGAALYVLLSKNYDEAYIKWAIGTIGVIVGYWLR